MFSSEIRETIFIAISSILLAIVLGFVSFLIDMRSDMANVRNSEIYASRAMLNYREFNKYNDSMLFDEDVIAAIKDYYDTGVRIKVVGNDSDSDAEVFYTDKYDARKNPDKVNTSVLKTMFPSKYKYKAKLVYGQVDISKITRDYVPPSTVNTNVSAIIFFYEGLR